MDKIAVRKFAPQDEHGLAISSNPAAAERGRSQTRKAVAGSNVVERLFSMGLRRADSATNLNSVATGSRRPEEDAINSRRDLQNGHRALTTLEYEGANWAGPAREARPVLDPVVEVPLEYDPRLKDAMFEEIERQAMEFFPNTHYIAPREKAASRKERSVEAWRQELRPSVSDLVNSTVVASPTLANRKGPGYRKPVPKFNVSPTRPLDMAKAKTGLRSASPHAHDPSRVAATARAMDVAARRIYRKQPNYAILDEDNSDDDDATVVNHHVEKERSDMLDPFMYEEFRSLLETHRIKKALKKYHVVVVPSRLNPMRGWSDAETWMDETDRLGSNYSTRIHCVHNTKNYLSLLRFKHLYNELMINYILKENRVSLH